MRRAARGVQRDRGVMRPVSDCHAASLEEAGRVLTYWVCRECGEACEADDGEAVG